MKKQQSKKDCQTLYKSLGGKKSEWNRFYEVKNGGKK
jgi:hypothetical protein